MSKKDYIVLAAAITATVQDVAVRTALVAELVPVLKSDNRNFSADRFAYAANVPAQFGY